jgi:predicted nuclease with RNAse H fold
VKPRFFASGNTRDSVPSSSVYLGIDVACAIGKRLPLCVVSAGRPLLPLSIPKHLMELVPRGVGNKEIAAAYPFQEAARCVASAINGIADETGWKVERIAVDAPAAPPATDCRLAENELSNLGLSSFTTPALSAWSGIREKCANHLRIGGTPSTLPHANKIWMLYGFELFNSLRSQVAAEVIEVYPYAIIRALLPACEHKSTERGYRDQLAVIAARTGWEPEALETRLKATVSGSRHDRLDAFMAAWVASLPSERRRAFGDAQRPDDSIWVPL